MNMLHTRALALAGGFAGAVLGFLCLAIYAIAGQPDPWMELFIGSGPTAAGWIVLIVESAAVGALLGWLVAAFYNRFARPRVAA